MLERPFYYASPNGDSLTANQTAYDKRIEIRGNADFVLRGMGMLNVSQAVAGRFRRPNSSFFTGDAEFMHLSGFMNTAGFARWTPIYPQIVYPKTSAFVYDLRDLGGAGDAGIFPFLAGVERYADDEIQTAPAPDGYIEHDHTIQVTQTITGAGAQVLDIPVSCVTGDAFAVRSLSWSFVGSEPLTMHCRLWDSFAQLFMNTWVPMRCLFAGPDAASRPYLSTVFPQIIIPPYGSLKLDLWNRTEAGPFTVELTFAGVRLVEVAQ